MRLDEIKQYKKQIDTEEEVWKLLNKHCKDAIGQLPIVRGMNEIYSGYAVMHGAAGKRMSANTSNHYTVILDAVLPKEFPKRSGSIICANWKNRAYAAGYGVPYAIVPFDGVKIGVCPGRDIFDTEISLSKHERATARRIDQWNNFYNDNDITDESFPKLIADFKKFLGRRNMWDLDPKTIKDVIAEAYSKPFKLATTADDGAYNDGEKHEVWIGGKCLAIDMLIYRSVMRNAKEDRFQKEFYK